MRRKLLALLAAASMVTAVYAETPPTPQQTVFNASGTWNVPSDTLVATVQAWGGGGGGSNTTGNTTGGGGGGGAYASSIIAVTPGNADTVTVGGGGTPGNAGGSSWFRSTITLLAAPGGPGTGASLGGAGGAAGSSIGSVTFSGGSGGQGLGSGPPGNRGGGGGGGSATATANGGVGGNGGSSSPGAGGTGQGNGGSGGLGTTAAQSGFAPGGGGGGRGVNAASGSGASGRAIISWTPTVWTLSGTILDGGGSPIAGVTVTATGGHTGSVVTNGSGVYTFQYVRHNSTNITLTPSLTGYTFVPVTRNVAGPVTSPVTGQDFVGNSAVTWVISGTILDTNTDPVENVSVAVTGGWTDTVFTDVNGFYSVTVNNNTATVTLTPTLAGYTFAPVNRSVTGPITADAPNQDFTATLNTYTISGTILDTLSSPVDNVEVVASGGYSATVYTNASGLYQITGVPHGATNITLTPTLAGYTFAPVTRTITGPVTGNVTAQDFAATAVGALFTITGTILDNLASPVENVVVTAFGGHEQTVTTNEFGVYMLTDVAENSTNIFIRPLLAGYGFSPTNRVVVGPVVADVTGQDFTATPNGLVCFSDNYNRGPLGGNWTVANTGGSFGNPTIVNDRLRLTDASGNVSTIATLNNLFPGFGNRIEVEFDFYAYGGTSPGADGIAVVLSDAAVTPAPGGFGGSLGYAQRDGGVDGFAGGWIGIGLDEWGNYSNPTEGRIGGPGFTAQAVAIRGSGAGASGYAYHAGTGTLTPPVDGNGNAIPPHRYRVIIDHANDVNAFTSVERDAGGGWTPLIAPYDAKAEPGQVAVPADWILSLTGSTGGANNIHEIDNLSVCATDQIGPQPDHFAISHSGNGVTCQAEAIAISVHYNAHTLVTDYNETISISTSTGNGDWTLNTGLGTFTPGPSDSGTATYTFAPADDGAVLFNLRHTHTGPVNINVTDGTISETTGAALASEDLDLVFNEAGFRILDANEVDGIVTQIAGKPSNVAPGAQSIVVQAIRTNTETGACEAALQGPTVVDMAFECVNPATCAGQQLSVNGAPVAANPSASVTSFTGVSLDFGGATDTAAPIVINYPDVGQIRMHARLALQPSGELMAGGSNAFVVRPFGLHVSVPGNPGATGPGGGVLTTAGTGFSSQVRAVIWQAGDDINEDGAPDGHADNDPTNNANLSDNPTAPNFGNEGAQVLLSSYLVAPTPGNDPGLGGTPLVSSFTAGVGSTTVQFDEVGVIEMKATISGGNYLGIGAPATALVESASGHVGRIRPHYFNVAVTPSCGPFTYSGQPFEVTVTARNVSTGITTNYDGASFSKLTTMSNAGSTVNFTENLIAGLDFASGTAINDEIAYTFAVAETLPETLSMRAVDADGTTSQGFSTPTLEIRSGRLAMQNANGTDQLGLPAPFRVETWKELAPGIDAWLVETDDNCTTIVAGNVVEGNYQEGINAGNIDVTGITYADGEGSIDLAAPNAFGSVDLTIDLDDAAQSWLKFDWNGDGNVQNPTGRASFGIFGGNPRRIYIREVY